MVRPNDVAELENMFNLASKKPELYTVVVLLSPDFWKMARKPVLRWHKITPHKNSSTNGA